MPWAMVSLPLQGAFFTLHSSLKQAPGYGVVAYTYVTSRRIYAFNGRATFWGTNYEIEEG